MTIKRRVTKETIAHVCTKETHICFYVLRRYKFFRVITCGEYK